MDTSTYRELLAIPAVRRILLTSTLIRIPLWAGGIVLVLHVVTHLHHSYAAAGLVETVYAVALAVSNPWRGRRLDRVGLRRAVAPSLVVLAACWSVAPWVSYPVLLLLVAVAGLFTVPQFSIVRLVLIGAAGPRRRTAALSIDSVMVEVSFMIGPVLGVLAATTLPTSWALLLCQALVVLGGAWLWLENPPLADPDEAPEQDAAPAVSRRRPVPAWVDLAVVGVFLVAVAATVVLTAEDLGTVAALRSMHHTTAIGWVLALWGASSAVGGIVYGALPRHPPSYVLIALLALTTAAVVLTRPIADRVGGELLVYAALLFLSGFFCAPTITATVDDLTGLMSPGVWGEAMGWHGSAMTLGSALGAPVAGVAIDAVGWEGAFLAGSGVGFVIAALAWLAVRSTTRARASVPVVDGGAGDGSRDGGTDPLVER